MFRHHVLSYVIVAKPKLLRQCLLLQTVAGYQCTKYLERLASPALLNTTRIVQTRVQNSRMISGWHVHVFSNTQFLLLQSEQRSRCTVVSQAFTNPCVN